MNQEDFRQYKEIEYYSNFVQAWISTKMERDKSILTLSTGAIGLLVTLANTYEIKTTYQLVLYIIATMSFLLAIICALWIFQKNAIYLEKVSCDMQYINDPNLDFLDSSLVITFVVGVFVSILVSISSISIKKDNEMSKDEAKIIKSDITQNLTPLNESLNGIVKIKPKSVAISKESRIIEKNTLNDFNNHTRSLNGIVNMRPEIKPPLPDNKDSNK